MGEKAVEIKGSRVTVLTGPLGVRKSTWLTEAEKATGRRDRKERGSLEDRSGTSGEEENRGREGKEE